MRAYSSGSVMSSAASSKESATIMRLSRGGSPWLWRIARRRYSFCGRYAPDVGGYQPSTISICASASVKVLSAAIAWSYRVSAESQSPRR
jgi:hypothetical protein